jgi:hypothetical protein
MRQKARRFNRPRSLIAAFPPVFVRVVRSRLQFRISSIHIAFSRQGEHGPAAFRNRGFAVMAALAMVCRVAAWCALVACSAASAAEAELHAAAAKPVCLNAAETREMVKSRRLLEPFAALKFAGAQRKAEALSARLCRTGEDFIYEITLLHRDGRLVHVEMEAATGKIASRPAHEQHETHESHESHEPPAKN